MDAIQSHCRELNRCNQRGGRMLSVTDLIDAKTLDIETAAYIAAAVSSGRSFLVGAVPGGAGKTTVMAALLNFLPPDVTIVPAESSRTILAATPDAPRTCYLCHEIGSGAYYAYLWGAEARNFFALTRNGHIVATNLHADTLEQTRDQLCGTNGVDEADFRRVNLMLFIGLNGSQWPPTRRIATIWESDGDQDHRLIRRFDPRSGTFEQTSDAGIPDDEVEPFKAFIEGLVADGVHAIEYVRSRVVEFLTH